MIVQPGKRAPDFELPVFDPGGAGAGKKSLGDLLRKGPAFLVFVKATCPTCVFALPLLDRIYRAYPDAPASVVAIAQESAEGASSMRRDLGLRMPVLLDSAPYKAGESFGLSFVPSGFWVGSDGLVQVAFESFEREAVAEINRRIAARAGREPAEIFPPDEGVPAFRPG